MPEQMTKQHAIERLEIFRRNGYLIEGSEICKAIDIAIDALKQSIVKPEQRHGRWILEREPDGTPYCLHCSECDPDFDVMYNVVATDYCPDCGEKMETDRVYEMDDYGGSG